MLPEGAYRISQASARTATGLTVCGELLGQRDTLLRLTHTEEMTAQVRRTPATSADVERELARTRKYAAAAAGCSVS